MAIILCKISGCESVAIVKSRELCGMHNARWRRHGDPEKTVRPYVKGSAEERFWPKVDKVSSPNGCWLWTAGTTHGYGDFSAGKGLSSQAHRFSYELEFGEIPKGLFIDHQCRNTLCVNPSHLKAVSPLENMQNIDLRPDNISGVRGVNYRKDINKWRAYVNLKGKQYSAGVHDTKEDAERAVLALRNTLHTNNVLDRVLN